MADNVTNNKIITSVELDVDQAAIDIVKLNSLASDSTKELSDRVDAKNKQVKIQNDLNKKTISDLEKQVKSLENIKGKEKEYEKSKAKLVKAKLNEVKVTERNSKAQAKLTSQYGESKGAMNKLNNATGGFIDKLKLLATNPIVLVLTLIVGVFKVLEKAVSRSEKATESFAKVGAFLSGIFNGIVAALEPLVELLGDALVTAIEKPGEAWDSFVGALQTGYDIWKTQILDRFLGNLKILSGTFQKGMLKMRIAWNEFTGDSEEAKKLEKSLDDVNKKIEEGYEANRIANQQLVDGYNAVVDGVTKFGKKAKDAYNKASTATENLANSERRLAENRIALEKQQLTSLRLAEKQRQIRDDTSKSMEERIAANKQLGVILAEQSKKELALAQLSLDIAKKKVIANGDDIASLEEVGAAEVKILEIKERITGQLSEQIVNETGLKKEATEIEKADAQALADFKKDLEKEELESLQEKAEREKEEALIKLKTLKITEEERAQLKLDIEAKYREDSRLAKFDQDVIDGEFQLEQDEIELEAKRLRGEATLAEELKFLEKKRDQELLIAGDDKNKKILIEKEYGATKAKIQKIAADTEKKRTEDLLNAGIAAAGEAFGIGKELSIATALVNTYKGISEVWSAKSETGLVGAGFLQKVATSAVTALQGFNTVKRIIGTKGPRGSKSSSRGGGFSAAASAAPTSVGSTDIANISSNNASRLGTDTSLSTNANQAALASTSVSGGGSNVVFSETAYSNFQNQVGFREDRTTIGG